MFEVVGQVEGRTCILVDDMIDTGGTITKAAEGLFDQGAAKGIVVATHGVMSGAAGDNLKNSQISEVVITNTLPIPPDRRFDKLTVLSIAPLIARAINEVFSDGSGTRLFHRQSSHRTGQPRSRLDCAGIFLNDRSTAVPEVRIAAAPRSEFGKGAARQ